VAQQDNRSMPQSPVIPVLRYADVRAAATHLCAAFGFVERLRIANHRVQLELPGGGDLVVAERPGDAERQEASIMLRVADTDTAYARAIAAGALEIAGPADQPYGERQATVEDMGGYRWTLSQSIADADPAGWGGELISPRVGRPVGS
jgi:uncharacterized glyoxalase superfamily protein PhnB